MSYCAHRPDPPPLRGSKLLSRGCQREASRGPSTLPQTPSKQSPPFPPAASSGTSQSLAGRAAKEASAAQRALDPANQRGTRTSTTASSTAKETQSKAQQPCPDTGDPNHAPDRSKHQPMVETDQAAATTPHHSTTTSASCATPSSADPPWRHHSRAKRGAQADAPHAPMTTGPAIPAPRRRAACGTPLATTQNTGTVRARARTEQCTQKPHRTPSFGPSTCCSSWSPH